MQHVQPLHPNLQHFVDIAPLIEKLFAEDVLITISDTEKIIAYVSYADDESHHSVVGHQLKEGESIIEVLRTNRENIFEVSKELFGSDLRVAIIPIRDEHNRAIGTLAATFSIQNRVSLIEIAKKFSDSSQTIHHSTSDLNRSAETLTHYMSSIHEAQQNLVNQVNDSAKILEMINTVAKSTRILGFNAGIEAARSGEHGLGFAVVAKEITKLADQSASSVNEINKLLEEMKKRVEEVSAIVNQTADVSTTQANAIHNISESIHELSNVAERIDELASKI